MKKEILFSEKQRFTQWWLWLILIGINGMFLYGIVKQVIRGEQFGDRPMSDEGLMILAGLLLLLTLLFTTFRLETRIEQDGIYVRFFPFHIAFRHYTRESITKVYVRKYSGILEYGGWGLRYGFGNGRAYTISGDQGLQLELKNNKRLLIGTRRPEEIKEALQKAGYSE